jgi:hypothetical protein
MNQFDILDIVNSTSFENVILRKHVLELWREDLILPRVNCDYQTRIWKEINGNLRILLGTLFVQSSKSIDENEMLLFRVKEFKEFVIEDSERTTCGLSLLCHCCRLQSWAMLQRVILKVHLILCNSSNSEEFAELIDHALNLLCDDRILHILEGITAIKSDQIYDILIQKQFKIHSVEADFPVTGWATPVGIVLNLSKMTRVEKSHVFALAKLIGHELAHFLGRIKHSFEISTPERFPGHSQSSFRTIVENVRIFHPEIDKHLESGLLFELSVIGKKFLYENECGLEIAEYLKLRLEDPDTTLPLVYDHRSSNIPECCVCKYDEQFAFCSSKEFEHAM